MKKNLTEMVFILDRSGSMHGLESDTIGGFNSMIEKQRELEGEALVSTVLFNDGRSVIHDRVDVRKVEPLTEKQYTVSGCTALLDAVGNSIHHIGNVHKYAREEDIPEHTVFIITTDGLENASREYSLQEIRKMVKKRSEKDGWEFLFLGANMDAFHAAEGLGIRRDRTANYHNDPMGQAVVYGSVSRALKSVRTCGTVEESWSEEVDRDYASRR